MTSGTEYEVLRSNFKSTIDHSCVIRVIRKLNREGGVAFFVCRPKDRRCVGIAGVSGIRGNWPQCAGQIKSGGGSNADDRYSLSRTGRGRTADPCEEAVAA